VRNTAAQSHLEGSYIRSLNWYKYK
jgi:hypothetical protein